MPYRKQQTGGWLLLITLVLLLATGMRFARIDQQSLWADEGSSAALAERSWARISVDAAADIHPPGYYMLLAAWEDVSGNSELALRLFSALTSVLAVATVYAIGNRFFDRWAGLAGGLLAAVNPFQIWYGQEARMYALLGWLAALSVLLTAAVLRIPGEMAAGRFRPKRAGLIIGGYVMVNAAGLYTHYTFPFILLVESLVFLIWLMRRGKKLHGLITWTVIQAVTLALYLPWLPTALHQVLNWPRLESQAVSLVEMAGVMAYGQTTPPAAAQNGLIPLLLLAVVGLFPPIEEDKRYVRFHERLGLVALWLLVPVAVPAVMGVIREPYLKFFVPVNLALLVLAGHGLAMGVRLTGQAAPGSDLNTWLTRLVLAIVTAAALAPLTVGLPNLYTNPDYARDDYRAMADRILEEAGPQAAVVLDAPAQVEIFTYYYPDGPSITPLPAADVDTEEAIERLAASHDRIYALYWGDVEQDPGRTVEQTLNERAFVAESRWHGRVRLVVYAVPAEAASAPEIPIGAQFGDTIMLEGAALSDEALQPGEALAVTLFWKTTETLDERYKVFVHLYGPEGGQPIAQHDGEPGGGIRITTTWEPGKTVRDNHGIVLPIDVAPGSYTLMVGVYDFEGNRLPVSGGETAPDNRLILGEIEVTP